jgi:transposase
MKRRGYQKFADRRRRLAGKAVVGIDPASEKHQAAVLDREGIQIGRSFAFPVSYEGYETKLWAELTKVLGNYGPEDLVFAIETSCALWKGFADYVTDKGYTVLLVSPLSTYYSRPLMNQDFSKTDPKDALLIATNARNGSYSEYRSYAPAVARMHRLSIAYEKLTKDRQRALGRLRSFMQEVFPEYISCVGIDTLTSLYLLERCFLPAHFRSLPVHGEDLSRVSRGNHGIDTLEALRSHAARSVGGHVADEEDVLRVILDVWIAQIRQIDTYLKKIGSALIELAQKTEHFEILTSIKGISSLFAARFIAECRGLHGYEHYKQIEKYAGANVRLMDSGKYAGTRKISKIGNKRLLRLIYLMTTQVVKFVPEIQIKFATRQRRKKCYRENIIACTPWLLKLITALVREKRPYVVRQEALTKLAHMEARDAA